MNPLKLQKVLQAFDPISWPDRLTAAEDRKLMAMKKSLTARPLKEGKIYVSGKQLNVT